MLDYQKIGMGYLGQLPNKIIDFHIYTMLQLYFLPYYIIRDNEKVTAFNMSLCPMPVRRLAKYNG